MRLGPEQEDVVRLDISVQSVPLVVLLRHVKMGGLMELFDGAKDAIDLSGHPRKRLGVPFPGCVAKLPVAQEVAFGPGEDKAELQVAVIVREGRQHRQQVRVHGAVEPPQDIGLLVEALPHFLLCLFSWGKVWIVTYASDLAEGFDGEDFAVETDLWKTYSQITIPLICTHLKLLTLSRSSAKSWSSSPISNGETEPYAPPA